MMLGIGKEAAIFLYAVLSGIVTLSCYQIVRLVRRLVPHHIAVISAEDFCYWVGVSIYLFRQMYHTTYGSVRWFFLLGVLGGSLLAYFTGVLLQKISLKWKKRLEKKREKR